MSSPTDSKYFRNVLGHYPTGVCVVAAVEPDGTRTGMTIGSFNSVSLDPPCVAFFVAKSSTTWPRIANVHRFCVNVLAHDQEEVCRRFASKAADRFETLSHRLSPSGMPLLDNVVAWIDCALHAVHEAGDHFIVLGRVEALNVERPDVHPLLFFRGGYGSFAPLAALREPE